MEFVASTPSGVGGGAGIVGISVNGAATPIGRTVLMIVNVANLSAIVKQVNVTFNGTTATNTPVLVEFVKSTQASNGTNGAVVTPVQYRGQGNTTGAGLTSQVTAYAGYVAEPTVLTVLDAFLIPPTSGAIVQLPLGDEAELIAGAGTMGLGVRITPTQTVGVMASIRFVQGLS